MPCHAQEAQIIDRVVAVVGQNIILQSDIEAQYLQFRLQGGIKGSASSIRCEILEDLMFQKLMLNQAEMDSITVTDERNCIGNININKRRATLKYIVG